MLKKKIQRYQLLQAIQFSERLSNATLWIEKAEELFVAAQILEVEVVKYWGEVRFEGTRLIHASCRKFVQGPYFLLIAYTLENYFKALLIHRNRESIRNRVLAKIPKYINEHNLLRLAHAVGMKLNVPEEELLFRLSNNSIWAGRYPVPADPNGIITVRKFSDGKSRLTAYLGPQDIDRIHAFIERCRKSIKQEIEMLKKDQPTFLT